MENQCKIFFRESDVTKIGNHQNGSQKWTRIHPKIIKNNVQQIIGDKKTPNWARRTQGGQDTLINSKTPRLKVAYLKKRLSSERWNSGKGKLNASWHASGAFWRNADILGPRAPWTKPAAGLGTVYPSPRVVSNRTVRLKYNQSVSSTGRRFQTLTVKFCQVAISTHKKL